MIFIPFEQYSRGNFSLKIAIIFLKRSGIAALNIAKFSEWMNESSPYRYFFSAPEKYPVPPGGESFESVCERTKNFIQTEIEADFQKNSRVMIVAHGALNKGIMCYIQNHGIKDYWLGDLQKNCGASIFDYDGKIWTHCKN